MIRSTEEFNEVLLLCWERTITRDKNILIRVSDCCLMPTQLSWSASPSNQWFDWFYFWCLMPLSAIFQLYHGGQFSWWKKPEYPERTTDHGQATSKLYHLRLGVECTLFCNLQSRARTHAVLVIGLYELWGNPTT